jgi:hypothetical protein
MDLEEHLKKRRMELEDRAIQVEQSAALQISEAYRTGYNDGYIQRAEDDRDDETLSARELGGA